MIFTKMVSPSGLPKALIFSFLISSLSLPLGRSETSPSGISNFRQLFISQVNSETPGVNPQAANQLIFYPSLEMTIDSPSIPTEFSPFDYLQTLATRTASFRSAHLFQLGSEHSHSLDFSPQALSGYSAHAALRQYPITMVIVPGIFGEFIRTRAFEEVFEAGEVNSTFAKAWQAKLSNSPPVYLPSYSLEKYSVTLEKIQNLVSLASIDDTDGTPLVRIVLFKTAPFSLETLGSMEERASQFNTRLKSVMNLLGEEHFQNLVLIGYSRGTTLALEMLAQAKASGESPYLSHVRGVVSLGGVTFGSALADKSAPQLAEVEASAASLRSMEMVKEISNDMNLWEKTKNTKENAEVIARNHLVFANNIKNYATHGYELSPAMPKADVKTTGQNLSQISIGNVKAIVNQILQVFDFSLETISFKVISQYNENVRRHNANVMRYNGNIARFQMFVFQTVQAARELSTESRIAWWKTRALPVNGIRYYSIAGTMSEPNASMIENELARSPLGFSFGSPDDNGLLQNFRDLRDYSGEHLNDSQVSINRVRFWPNLIATLNPQNAGMDTQFLGVLGTHHWGLALRIVTDTKDGRVNPFPRVALMKSLAAQAALDLQQKVEANK